MRITEFEISSKTLISTIMFVPDQYLDTSKKEHHIYKFLEQIDDQEDFREAYQRLIQNFLTYGKGVAWFEETFLD